MPKLWLFGAEVELMPENQTLTVSDLGGLTNKTVATLRPGSSANKPVLELSFEGAAPQGEVKFSSKFDCEIDGDRLKLKAVHADAANKVAHVRVTLPFNLGTVALQNPIDIKVGEGYGLDDEGVGFADGAADNPLGEALQAIPLNGTLRAANWGDRFNWTPYLITYQFTLLDHWTTLSDAELKKPHAIFKPRPDKFIEAHEEIYFRDNFLVTTSTGGRRFRQQLHLNTVRASASQVRVFARPHDHVLLIHPDVLSTENAAAPDNDIFYQYALANGLLEILYRLDAVLVTELNWKGGSKGESPTTLVVFRLTDENNNPLVVESSGFPLVERAGVNRQVNTVTPGDKRWEMTLTGTVIHTKAGANLSLQAGDASLKSMDPVELAKIEPKRKYPWLSNGKVVTRTSPAEIHGLCQGAYLKCNDSGMQIRVGLLTEDILSDIGERLFTKSDLELKVGNWTLKSQLEEREVFLGASTVAKNLEVGMREARAKNTAETLKLPMIDTSYALANLVGAKRSEATIALAGHQWLRDRDQQFVSRLFEEPKTAESQTHTSGFEVKAPVTAFNSIIDMPPGVATDLKMTARTGAALESALGSFVHGGERVAGTAKDLENRLNEFEAEFRDALIRFESFWNLGWRDADAEVQKSLRALREYLAAKSAAAVLPLEYFKTATARLKEIVSDSKIIPGLSDLSVLPAFPKVKIRINELDVKGEDLKKLWDDLPGVPADERDIVRALFDYLWSPSGPTLYRRALAAVWARQVPPELAQLLIKHQAKIDVLKAKVLLFAADIGEVEKYFNETVPGFLTQIKQGVDPLYARLVTMWEQGSAEWDAVQKNFWEEKRRLYGISFTPDVYQALLKEASDAEQVIALLKKAYANDLDPQIKAALAKLKKLQDLLSEPPAYIFHTRRFPVVRPQSGAAEIEVLWKRSFDLCRLGLDKVWNFLLDEESSVIVKLNGSKSLPDIIREIHNSYKSGERPNPLGLASTAADPVADFINNRLHSDLKSPHWRGILIIKPIADIGKDEQLRDLCGFEHIAASYVAIGGAEPDINTSLDIYANIFQEAPKPPRKKGGDVSLTLLKFDVTIKHTQVESGEIVFVTDIDNLLGAKTDEKPAGKKFEPLYIRGSLAQEPKTSGEERSPSSFQFAAWFEKPISCDIDIAFLKSLAFKALRVGTNKGQTSIDIDADLVLQNWKVNGTDFIKLYDGMENPSLNLTNFRILLPKLSSGALQRLGLPRALNFDFPSVTINLPKPRVMNLQGIEIKPFKIGFVRGIGDTLKELRENYNWIGEFGWPEPDNQLNFEFPFIRFEVDFGKLPSFGGNNLNGLKFDMALGLKLPEKTLKLGLAGFEAKDLTIDLFRLLTLRFEELKLGRFIAEKSGKPKQDVMAIKTENVQLKILDWSVLPENSKMQFLLAQVDDNDANKKTTAALGFYSAPANPNGPFFQLYWLLLAHNIEVDEKILNYLLFKPDEHDQAVNLMKQLVVGDRINAHISDEEGWLFGISFALKDLIDRCRFILHDQHYYGISLKATYEWFRLLFGEDGIALAYIPGPTREQDKFRTNFRIPALDMMGTLRSGEIGLQWCVNWDYLVDFGYPWRGGAGYDWLRAFSVPAGAYEAKFGFFFEKRTQLMPGGETHLTLAAGVGFYLGYYFGFSSSIVWLRAGIGVFAIFEGEVVFKRPPNTPAVNLLKYSIERITVTGVIGIFAYGEGGIDVWVLSARFRVQVQASIAGRIDYIPRGTSALTYAAQLAASYSASVRVGCGFFSFTFSVSGSVAIGVSGRVLLN